MTPSIDTEVHKALRDIADDAAIAVFAENVRKLLLAAPFGSKSVLGVDPGLRTGCKLAVVDESGKYVGSGLMHLETPAGKAAAAPVLADLVKKGNIARHRRRQRHRRARDRDLRARGAAAARDSTCRS